MCWTACLVALIEGIYFCFSSCLFLLSLSWEPWCSQVPPLQKHQAQELCLTKSAKSCSRGSKWGVWRQAWTRTTWVNQEEMTQNYRQTLDHTSIKPPRNWMVHFHLCTLTLHLLALERSMYWRCWVTSRPCAAPLKICWAPPGCWCHWVHVRFGRTNPQEISQLLPGWGREATAPGRTCPNCFRVNGYCKATSTPKQSFCSNSCQTPGA